jgi:hypothetical protein
MSLRERLAAYSGSGSRLGGLITNAYNQRSPSYSGIRGTIYSTAQQEGIDPYLALATVENEGGFYDDPNEYYNRVGDQGQSYGPYQEHVLGRGAQAPRDVDPVRQTQRFAADVRRLLESGFQGSPGQLIAAAQRPYDPIGAAQKYQASYDRYSTGGPSDFSYPSAPSGEEAEGFDSGPRLTPEQIARLRQASAAPGQSAGFGGVLGNLGRGIGAQLGAYGQGIQSIPQNVQAVQENPITRNLPFGLGPALGVLSSLPTAEPFLEGAGFGEGPGIQTPLGKLTTRGAIGAVADPLSLLPVGKVAKVAKPAGRLAGRAAEEVGTRAVGRFAPQTAIRRAVQALPEGDIAGERNARFILGQGEVIPGPEGVLHEQLAREAGTDLDRLMASGAVRIFPESGGRVAVQAVRPLNPEQAASLSRVLSGAREIFVETPSLSASFNNPQLAVRRIQQSFGGVPQGQQGLRQLVGAEEGFARIPEGGGVPDEALPGAPSPSAAVSEGELAQATPSAEAITEPLPTLETTPQQRAIAHSQANRILRNFGVEDAEPELQERVFQLALKDNPSLDEINELGAELAARMAQRPSLEEQLTKSVEGARGGGAGKPPEPPKPPVAQGEVPPKPTMSERALGVANIPRALKSSFDISAPLRQGAYFAPSRPTEWGRAFGAMIKAVGSEKYARAVDDSVRQSRLFPLAEQSGLYIAPLDEASNIAKREEAFMTDYAQKLPLGIGAIVRASERAYITFLNKLRIEVFETIADEWGEVPAKNYESLANFINAGTGRGRLGSLQESGPLLNALFFSPRFFMSRIENVTNLADPIIRKQVANALWKFYGTGSAALGLMAAAGTQVETDPRSADFGKVKIGNTRYDFWAGNQQIARYMAQLATGQTKTVTGKNAGKITDKDRIKVVGDFLRSKLAPLPGTGVNLLSGKDFLGEKLTPVGVAVDTLAPIFLQDLYEAGQAEGVPGLIKTAPAGLGIGVQTFGGSTPAIGGQPRTAPPITTQPRAPVSTGAGSSIRERLNAYR